MSEPAQQTRRRVFFDDAIEVEARALLKVEADREYEVQLAVLEAFEAGSQWSNNGAKCEVHAEDLDDRYREELAGGIKLKAGAFGVVSKINYRNVCLVRKTIRMGSLSKEARKLIRQEGSIGQSLDSHRHIIKLVGTFWEAADDPEKCTFNILTFPVAVCDLEQTLEDCEELSSPLNITGSEWPRLMERLSALSFDVNKPMRDIRKDMNRRLLEIMGCMTEGILWMHSQYCQHRDVKPANVLLRPGGVLITDFGISRDRRLAAQTTTEFSAGGTLGYMPPEVRDGEANNPAQTDVYSLGCVFLRILSVIHGPNTQLEMIVEQPHPNRDRLRERQFKEFIAIKGITSQHQILPLRFQKLIANMLEDDRRNRPTAEAVNTQLRLWSTAQEKYHGPCCQQPLGGELSGPFPATVSAAEEDRTVQGIYRKFITTYIGRSTWRRA